MGLNELSLDGAAQAKRNLRAAIEKVAGKLGNTSYHLSQMLRAPGSAELLYGRAVLALLRGRLAKEAERPVSKKQRANAA